jgi:hypothetical protein
VGEAQFFFPKRKREFSFPARRKEAKVQERGTRSRILNRRYRCAALGVVCLSRRRYSWRWSRAVGPDETRPQAELEHGSRASIKGTGLQKGVCAKRLVLIWFMAASRRR